MKKLFAIILVLVLIAAGITYLYVPSTYKMSKEVILDGQQDAVFRNFVTVGNWKKWWPGEISDSGTAFLHEREYTMFGSSNNVAGVNIDGNGVLSRNLLSFFALRPDSMLLRWELNHKMSLNPITRWKEYNELKTRSSQIDQVLNKMKTWFASSQAIYGYDIQIGKVNDSLLLYTFMEEKGKPTMEQAYSMIDRITQYAKQNGATVSGYPMLNIMRIDSNNHLTRVAVIIDREIPETGNITLKRMIPTADAVILEVKGGEASVEKAIKQAENFISDKRFATPAISFQQLKTNRMIEKDTAGWVTRLVYPIL